MAIANRDLYKELEYNFLYKSDINSIHILLNLYDLDKNIRNIYPKYISKKNLKNNLLKIFPDRNDKCNVCTFLSNLLHEDINRLELYICLEGYKNGHFNKLLANRLENVTIKNLGTEELYSREYLYHYKLDEDNIGDVIEELKKEVTKKIEEDELGEVVSDFYTRMISPNILGINEKIEINQLGMENKLSKREIKKLDIFILNMLLSNMESLYRESYWFGLNDRVLKRYR